MSTARPMTDTQRAALRAIAGYHLFPGYCELMLDLGLTSYKAVDWVLDALERRGMVKRDEHGDYIVTDAGAAALKNGGSSC